MRSTWPDSKAATRESASGIGMRIILSALGMRALSQYSAFFTSSARSRGTSRASLNGPVPDGELANFSQSRPTFSYCAGLEIKNQSIWYGKIESMSLVVISIVYSSSLR
jgi:hypothetical protein